MRPLQRSAARWCLFGRLLLFATTANLAACAGSSADSKISLTGSGGSTGSHCTTTACLPSVATHIKWAVEIDPPNIAGAAVTQLPSVDLYGGGPPLTLPTDAQSAVTATFTAPATEAAPTSASVVLTIPSPIPGRPGLTFQAAAATTSTNATSASLNVPSGLLMIGGPATMTLVPLPPADQQSPPYSFPVPMLAATLGENIATDNLSINGKLLDADAMPTGTIFVARAFQGGAQVSNAPLTQADGSFQLLIAPASASSAPTFTVQLTPQSQNDPWFVSNSIPLSDQIPTPYPPFMLPAYTPPNPIAVVVKDADNNNVSGALVKAQTMVYPTLGTTDFARSATTGVDGTATLSLLPGSKTAPLTYSFVVVPQAGSSAATTCPPSLTLPVPNPATLPTFTLQRRPQLVGTVTDGQGYPVANVAITATPGTDPTGSCPSAPAAPGNTTTDANGSFSLFLDPGTYQLDYDPPAGSAGPRLTQYQVPVGVPAGVPDGGAGGGADGGAETISYPVQLPVAAALQGTVVAPDGVTHLPSATVRFFETHGTDGGTPTAPVLRAQAVTDANGAFRVAVPLPN